MGTVGRISSYQTLGTVDGPGVRFVLFMQGCNLRCSYCHNPETWELGGGYEATAQDIFAKIVPCIPYFGDDGGVTISGGEPFMQAEFLYELLHLCKEHNLHTAIDTNGSILNQKVKDALALADLILLDIKMTTNEKYLNHIGCSFDCVINFLDTLELMHKDVWIRQVIVSGINDDIKNILKLKEIASKYSCIKKIELLPFLKLCLEKYKKLEIPFKLINTPQTSPETILELYEHLN